jgi:hypothetical protein
MKKIEGEEVGATRVTSRGTMGTKYCFKLFTISMTNFGIDVSAYDEVGVPRDILENRGECLEELFMRGIVAGMVDGCKEKGERFPFDSPPFTVKTVKFQIKADESTRKSTRGCRRDW